MGYFLNIGTGLYSGLVFALMIAFGVFLLAIGLAAALSLSGYGLMRLFMGAYLDGNLAVIWESLFPGTPYRPVTGQAVLIGLAASAMLSMIGALLARSERQRTWKITRIETPAGPTS
jgi:hypothetical protein